MTRPITLAVVGATGEVGRAVLEAIDALDLPVAAVRTIASARSVGKEIELEPGPTKVVALSEGALRGCDAAIFCTPAEISRTWAPRAWAVGCPAVDVSGAFREDLEVALVLPEVNPAAAAGFRARGVVACPSPLATAVALLLRPLGVGARRVVATHLAPASGEGRAGVAELEKQARDLLALREPEPAARFPHRLAFNAVPLAGVVGEGGVTAPERSAAAEVARLLGAAAPEVHATVIRVPIFYGDLVSLHLELSGPVSPDAARERLRGAPGVKLIDDPAGGVYPMPMLASQEDAILVGRIRAAGPDALDLVAAFEAPRRGAATTALGIVRLLVGSP